MQLYQIDGMDIHCDEILQVKEVASAKYEGRRVTLVKCDNGHVYVLGQSTINLLSSYGSNEAVRRLACKMLGTSLKDLNAARKEKAKSDLAAQKNRDFIRLRSRASRLGYRLVKVEESK